MAVLDIFGEKQKLQSKLDQEPVMPPLPQIFNHKVMEERKKVKKKPQDLIYEVTGKLAIVVPPLRLVHGALFLRKHLLAISVGFGLLITGAIKLLSDSLTKAFNSMKDWTGDFGTEYTPGITGTKFNGTLYKETSPENIIKNKIIVEAISQGVDPNLALAVAKNESGYRQSARSKAGAVGIFQLMPSTAKGLGVDPYTEEGNIKGGIKYLKYLLDKFNGNERLAVAAYNAGPGAVQKAGGVPNYKETKNYVNNVLAHKKKLEYERPNYSIGAPSVSSGTKFGGYTLDKGVTVSKPVAQVLGELSGTGNVSSGIRQAKAKDYKNGGVSERSHAYGNKFDIRVGGQSFDQCVSTLINIGVNYAVIEIGMECFGPRWDNKKSVENARNIYANAKSRSSKFKQRCDSGDLKVWTDWGWSVGGTGPHYDVLIDPGRVKINNYNQNKKYNNEVKKPTTPNKTQQTKTNPKVTNKPKGVNKPSGKNNVSIGSGKQQSNVVLPKTTTPAPGYTYKNSVKGRTY